MPETEDMNTVPGRSLGTSSEGRTERVPGQRSHTSRVDAWGETKF